MDFARASSHARKKKGGGKVSRTFPTHVCLLTLSTHLAKRFSTTLSPSPIIDVWISRRLSFFSFLLICLQGVVRDSVSHTRRIDHKNKKKREADLKICEVSRSDHQQETRARS